MDYERLEFYGDSVISLLVILELFLTGPKQWKEAELDFNRIKTVSNMNFTTINKKNGIHVFMITESAFNDFTPPGIDRKEYNSHIKNKHTNEIESKIMYLRKEYYLLE